MATYSKRELKNGTIVYDIQAQLKDEFGKTKFKCTNWRNAEGLSAKQAERVAYAFGEAWEQNLRKPMVDRNEHENDTFEQIARLWLEMKSANFSRNHILSAEFTIERMIEFFGNKRFKDIKLIEVRNYFSTLSSAKIKKISAMIKDSKVDEFYKALDNYGIRKMEREGIAARPTLYYIHGGDKHEIEKRKQVEWKTAKTICESLGLKVEDYFDKNIAEQGYRKETILGYKRILSAIYTFAVEHDIVPKNLASGTYVNSYIGGEQALPKEILSDEEVDKLITVLDKHSKTNGKRDTTAIYLLLLFGMRKCEL